MTKYSLIRVEPDHEQEWDCAQRIQISADLISAAKIQLSFLATVERSPCLFLDDDCILQAVERYENYWLPLLARCGQGTSSGYPLVPPLDCAWIWHLHQLSPVQYARDCQKLFGKILESKLLTFDKRDDAMRETQELWISLYTKEPYCLNMRGFESFVNSPEQCGTNLEQSRSSVSRLPRVLTYDFVKAARRQRDFWNQVSQPYMSDTKFLFAAQMRYKSFLYLVLQNAKKPPTERVFLVPTYDIDLLWHSHMKCPVAYTSDTTKLLGYVFDHDDSNTGRSEGEKLDMGFKKTSEMWENAYGAEYSKAGVLYRGSLSIAEPRPPSAKLFCGDGFLYEKKELVTPTYASMQDHLKKRLMSEVRVGIIGLKNMRRNYRELRLFLSLHKNSSSSFTFRTFDHHSCFPPVQKGTCRFANVHWTFETEFAPTEALNVYVDFIRERIVFCSRERKYFKTSGVLKWSEVTQSPTFSAERSYTIMVPNEPKPPAVRLSVSCTPPVVGNHLIRTMPEPTDNLGNALTNSKVLHQKYQQGKWLSRSAYDHTGSVVYVIRIEDKFETGQEISPLGEKQSSSRAVYVHKGGWTTHAGPQYTTSVPAGKVVARTEQIQFEDGNYTWSIFNGEGQLTVNVYDENIFTFSVKEKSSLETMSLVRGRRLQYEVEGGKEEDEKNFVTLIRYRAKNPQGVATALFNWKYGVFEISPGENVILILLLSFAIKMSIYDSIRHLSLNSEKRLDKFAYAGVRTSHWGNTRESGQRWWWLSETGELYFAEGGSLASEESYDAPSASGCDSTVWVDCDGFGSPAASISLADLERKLVRKEINPTNQNQSSSTFIPNSGAKCGGGCGGGCGGW